MTILPINPAENSTEEALFGFFSKCQEAARAAGQGRLVSISLAVSPLDPLAVLESIFEPGERHCYIERPSQGMAVAGAEAVREFTAHGPARFQRAEAFIRETLEQTIAVGVDGSRFCGPHFFAAFTFHDEVEADEPFAPATVFVPRWQVGISEEKTVAVANIWLEPDTPLAPVVERVWRARSKFGAFDYSQPDFVPEPEKQRVSLTEVGEPGAFNKAVDEALERINRGEFAKIVLARAKLLQADTPLHPLRVLNGLRQRFPDCFAFSLANSAGQSFIGASPETLALVRSGKLETEALAGSARRGTTASEDAALGGALLRSEKDLNEHRLVLGSIARRLHPLGINPEYAATPSLRRLANVQHLHTAVSATLPNDISLVDVISRLHPTPAVGGTPREAAVPCIRALEGFPRGLYAGALGYIDSKGDGLFFVGLRSALIDGPLARLYAGAGIVAGSSGSRELAETDLKFRAMEDALLDR